MDLLQVLLQLILPQESTIPGRLIRAEEDLVFFDKMNDYFSASWLR
jgi:hypothetical protein